MGRVMRALVALAVALAALAPAATLARTAVPVFGAPTATAAFDDKVEFTVELTADVAPEGVNLELWFPGAIGPFLVPVQAAVGRQTLRHARDIATDGHLAPNTVIRSRWAATDATGTVTRSAFASVTYADTRFSWRTLAGDVVRVHWYDGSTAFGQRALDIAQRAIEETAALLGVVEKNAVDVFIYADTEPFRSALGPGLRENVGGLADSGTRTLFTLLTPGEVNDPWAEILITHELTHLVFNTAVDNPYRDPPVWLNEGLAVYQSEGYGGGDQARVNRAVDDGTLIPLSALAGSYPRQGDRIPLAYAEGASAVDFLVRAHGEAAMVALVRAYADGVSDDRAFTSAIGRTFATFEQEWLADLGAEVPARYGPQPPPPGPLPPGWTSASPAPGPTQAPGAQTAGPAPAAPRTPAPTAGPGPEAANGAGATPMVIALGVVAGLIVVGVAMAWRRRATL